MRARKKVLAVGLIFMFVAAGIPAAAGEMVDMEFKQAPLVDVFQILGQLGGYNVLVDPSVTGQVTFAFKDLTVEEALDLVTRTTGYRYKLMGNTLVISSSQRLKTEFGSEDFRFVGVKHVGVEAAQRLISLVAPNVKTYVDREQNLLVLFGLTADLDMATTILRQYDQESYAVSGESGETVRVREELATQAVAVFYADGEDILHAVGQRWPLREFRFDERTGNIMGETTAEEWLQVEAFVKEKDLPGFILRGLLGAQGQARALVEYRGVTTLVQEGDLLHDWLVEKIGPDKIEFGLGERQLIIRMGR